MKTQQKKQTWEFFFAVIIIYRNLIFHGRFHTIFLSQQPINIIMFSRFLKQNIFFTKLFVIFKELLNMMLIVVTSLLVLLF